MTPASDETSGTAASSRPNPFTAELKRAELEIKIDEIKNHPIMVGLAKGNDLGRVEAFLHREENDVKWCPAYGAWYVWHDDRWEIDRRERIGTKVTELADAAKEMASEAWNFARDAGLLAPSKDKDETEAAEKLKASLNSMKKSATCLGNSCTINNLIAVCKLEQQIVVDAEDLDSDPWLAGVENGILDLKDGNFFPADRTLMVTKRLSVEYHPEATCPLWERFISDVMMGDTEMVEYLQQSLGYSLTGLMSEQVFWFMYGTGKNGKSTLVETLQALGGDYLLKSPETLLARDVKGREPSRDVALLPGVRLLLGNETNSDVRLNTNIVKSITGGDTMSGTPLYKQSFQFKPSAKLWMYGNHKPVISEQDEGIWRRVMLIPFEYEVPEDKRDFELDIKLRKELSGILNWLIAGLRKWQKAGYRLNAPEKVRVMVKEYREDEDDIGAFLLENVATAPGETLMKDYLYDRYKEWSDREGVRLTRSSSKLTRLLKSRKSPKMEVVGRYWQNIRLLVTHEEEDNPVAPFKC